MGGEAPASINLGAAPPSIFDVEARAGAREFIYSDRDHCIAVQGRTILTYSTRQPTLAFFNAWTRAMQQLADADASKIASLTIIDSSGARPPDDTSRKAIRQAFARHSAKICAFAYVVEGEGFAAATIRAAVSLITMAERHPFPLRVFATVADAITWVLPRLPEHGVHDGPALVALADAMRRQTQHGVPAA
jgi:hypothetical protein